MKRFFWLLLALLSPTAGADCTRHLSSAWAVSGLHARVDATRAAVLQRRFRADTAHSRRPGRTVMLADGSTLFLWPDYAELAAGTVVAPEEARRRTWLQDGEIPLSGVLADEMAHTALRMIATGRNLLPEAPPPSRAQLDASGLGYLAPTGAALGIVVNAVAWLTGQPLNPAVGASAVLGMAGVGALFVPAWSDFWTSEAERVEAARRELLTAALARISPEVSCAVGALSTDVRRHRRDALPWIDRAHYLVELRSSEGNGFRLVVELSPRGEVQLGWWDL